MEGVGARLGRSSTRYGPTTVFTGPVRKWKKKWVHVSASSAANHNSQANGNNGSHLLLYKWAPISQSNNNNGSIGDKNSSKEDSAEAVSEELPKKRFRYIPVAVLEEQKKEDTEKVDEDTKSSEADPSSGTISKGDGVDGKPDINDVPMEEAQASDQDKPATQDLNETSLDLSLGLKGHEGDQDSDTKLDDQSKDGQ